MYAQAITLAALAGAAAVEFYDRKAKDAKLPVHNHSNWCLLKEGLGEHSI